MMTVRDKTGRIIPDNCFESEPILNRNTPVRKENQEAMDAHVERIKAQVAADKKS